MRSIRKLLTTLFALIAVGQLPTPINSQCFDTLDTVKSPTDLLYFGQRNFTVSLLQSLQEATPNESLFFSPHSTYHALLLAYFGAKGQTEESLKELLKLDWATSKADVSEAYHLERKLRIKRAENRSVEFHSVDKIFVAQETKLRECLEKQFSENIGKLDFSHDPEGCRKSINNLVNEVTKGNIKDVLVPGSLTEATKLVLANAAYFKGQWASKFDPEHTQMGIFYTHANLPVYVEMMEKTSYYNYALDESLNCVVLELPYLGEEEGISMFIFLPTFVPNAIEDLLGNITADTLTRALESGGSREVHVKLPKISFEKTYELVPVLKRMGVGDLFESTSNLTGFTEESELKLDDAVHKAKIEINEEGSTAAAATVLFSFRSSRPLEPAEFVCDHPFLFLIHDQQTKEILFSGVYKGPAQ